ncbi:MAG: hypothetical protein R3F59_28335 [Myxococcota bacterium]
MRRRAWAVAIAAAALGCNEGEPTGGAGMPSGTQAEVTCYPENSVTYEWCTQFEGSCDDVDVQLIDGNCAVHEGQLGGTYKLCIDYDEREPHGAAFDEQIRQLCQADCGDFVRDQAEALGRCAGTYQCEVLATYAVKDCREPEATERALGLTYTPIAGPPVAVTGTLRYHLDPVGRLGRTGQLVGLSLDAPLTVTVGERDATALLGYPVGTTISVGSVALAAPVPLSLDARGVGTVRAEELTLTAVVTIDEPGGLSRTLPVYAAVPWDVSVYADDQAFRITPFTGPFGGTFAPSAGGR